ncbi:FAD-binding oxidoreductase [Endozoicomonas sp. SCSIO W0465]|uniref:FAD-binding oxidoreductase n=1 Tax=Endozoicomonas sp. SCSIO W0465 TaxID=2918516 RepID=UPI0020757968|nr:FAD-binding oxidoreductase [Endozoicomonas sp. SCSIO W0465]USE37940.1 FAD-binding oxidoreductase [Endozoicomonas sp. SCSIO W0465]
MPGSLLSAKLYKTEQLSANTLQLSFELEQDESTIFNFIAGQFLQLQFEIDGERYKRSYSIANTPDDFTATGQLQVALSLVSGGVASGLFQKAPPGIELNIAGPFGALTLPETFPGQLILAGTGTGIAPYRSMIPQLQTLTDKGTAVTVVKGFRYREESIYAGDFAQLSNIKYRTCLSREPNVNSANNEYAGHVQDQFDALNLNPEKDVVYLCGNPNMIDDCVALLRDRGLSPRQIKREKYVYSGH